MDKETRDKHYRIVGALEAVERAAQGVSSMPCDSATYALIEVARTTLNKAVLSAWSYAEKQTAESEEVGNEP